MTDKEKIEAIKDEIECRIDTDCYNDNPREELESLLELIDSMQEEPEYLEEETTYCAFSTSRYTDKERKSLCKGCEEECEFKPVTPVWHDANEIPTDKSKVIVWLGEELNEIVQCHYMYGKFVEKIPTEEYGRYVLIGNEIEGYSRQFVSNKKRADLTELVVKWAYIKDLLKL